MKSSNSEMSSPSLAQQRAAVGTGATGRRVHDGLAWQMCGQCTWCTSQAARGVGRRDARGVFGGRDWLIGSFGLGGEQQFPQCQLQLPQFGVDALGGAPEAPAFESGDLGNEFGDQLVAPEQQAL